MTPFTVPMTTRPVAGQVLDDAFARWRQNFKTMTLVIMAFHLPPALFTFFHSLNNIIAVSEGAVFVDDPASYNRVVMWTLFVTFLFTVATFAVNANIVFLAWRGRTGGVTQALSDSGPRLGGFVLMAILAGLVGFAAMFGVGVLVLAGPIGALIGFVGLFALMAPLAHAPAVFWAGAGARAAISRSFALSGGRYWKVFSVVAVGLTVLLILRLGAATMLLALIGTESVLLWTLLTGVANLLSEVVGLPLLAALSVSLYIDAIVTKEGFDVREMIARLPPVEVDWAAAPPPAPPPPAPPPPPVAPEFGEPPAP